MILMLYNGIYGQSSDATLSDIQTDGQTIEGFNPSVTTYFHVSPNGTNAPEITVTTTHSGASVVINKTTDIPGWASIDVTAENGIETMNYWITFLESDSTDTYLTNILIDGDYLDGFDPDIMYYEVLIPNDATRYPFISGNTYNPASTTYISYPPIFPGQIIDILVTAQDGITTRHYEILFYKDLSTDSELLEILINGEVLLGFDPGVFEYTYELSEYIIADIEATASDINAEVGIYMPTFPNDDCSIVVIAEDGVTYNIYTIHFTYSGTGIGDLSESDIIIYPNPTSDYVMISGVEIGSNVSLFDVSGRIVYNGAIISPVQRIDLTGCKSGLYVLKMSYNNQVLTKTIILK